jgi:bifunctional non-homologous end joining protein LigD
MALEHYNRKRDFARTPEPRGEAKNANGFSFVVQKHAARRLHYDFRLELDGVLLSWAVPKGPSLDPGVKRLAVQTEDHPIEYGSFEGVIPKGEYGGGSVLVWDRGRWIPEGDARESYRRGRLTFTLEGEKLHGRFHLVRTRGQGAKNDAKSWLLIKSGDEVAERGSDTKLVDEQPASVLSGRTLPQIERDPDRVWHSKVEASEPAAHIPDAAAHARARKAALPGFVEPQLATLVQAAPEGDDWLHELKLDGYRILVRIDRGKVRLLTRRGHDWSARMPSVQRVFAALPFSRALIDGELCVLREDGASDFQRLQNSLQAGRDEACTYFAFDLLHFEGADLRALPLLERKALLREALSAVGAREGRVRYNDHVQGGGPRFFAHACKLGVEGVVSKRADAAYSSGRSRAWLKIKCVAREEFVIGGYTQPAGARSHFGALLLGSYDARGALHYAGKVGTGFTQQSLSELHAQLARIEQKAPAFVDPPRGAEARGVHWLRPELVAEVQYAERTAEGFVRHASFQGLRNDKAAEEVHAEQPVAEPANVAKPRSAAATHAPRLTNPKRVLYPEQNITKLDLARYYLQVAPYILPHVERRPLTLVRCPEGYAKGCFFQKHPGRGVPRAIGRVRIEEKRAALDYMTIASAEGLVGLVQLGALEIHTWGSRTETLECPDQLVFDLDPDEGLAWARMIEAAQRVRERLADLGLTGFLKTTGGKGLHIVVPIEPRTKWDGAKQFSKALVESIVRDEPRKYLATMSKEKRKGKVFLDYLRNGRGATAVAAYSTRARAGATVSAPLAWEELTPDLRPDRYTLQNMPQRLAALGADPWREFARARRPIGAAMLRGSRRG